MSDCIHEEVCGTCDVKPEDCGYYEQRREKCCYIPDEQGYQWRTDDGDWQEEEDSASDECWSASCDKCGYTMIVGDDGGWFRGYDDQKEWWDEDGKKHCGFILEPIFNYCPNCGREVEQ